MLYSLDVKLTNIFESSQILLDVIRVHQLFLIMGFRGGDSTKTEALPARSLNQPTRVVARRHPRELRVDIKRIFINTYSVVYNPIIIIKMKQTGVVARSTARACTE